MTMKSAFLLKAFNSQHPIDRSFYFAKLFAIGIFASASLGGCTYMATTPDEENYFSNYPYVDKDVVLRREATLCEVPDNQNFRAFRKLVLAQNSFSCVNQAAIIFLPVGTSFNITAVKPRYMPMYGNTWYALGELKIDKQKYKFEYRFADLPKKFPPPWEKKTDR